MANRRELKAVFMRRRAEKLSYHKYKVLEVPPQNGRRRTAGESGHEAPLSVYLFGLSVARGKGYTGKGNSLSMHPSEARSLSVYPWREKDDDFNFKLVLK